MGKLFKKEEVQEETVNKEEPVVEQTEQNVEQQDRLKNYTLIELLHLSYLIRDSLEYCHAQINVTEENFNRRKLMSKQILEEGKFTEKWINNHPNEEIRNVYPKLVSYFHNIYDEENYVNFSSRKVDQDKIVDFVEETIKNYQFVEDVLAAFYREYKKGVDVIDKNVEKCIFASWDYYRVIVNWLFFNEVIRNDGEFKKAQKASGGKPSYEVNYNLNILKRLIAGFNFNRQKYLGDKIDIKQMFENSMTAFKALDGTLFKEMKEKNGGKDLSQDEIKEIATNAINGAAQSCIAAIKTYEPIWRETYNDLMQYMKDNPAVPVAANA